MSSPPATVDSVLSTGGLESALSPLAAPALSPAASAISATPALSSAISGTDALAWLSIGLFVVALALQWRGGVDAARTVAAGAWVIFGVFWLTMVPYYYLDAQSPLQTVLSLAALPLCAYTGYLLYRGRTSLLLLSKAVAIMGIIYLPAETIPFARQWLIETTAAQTHYGMELLGYSPGINEGANGYESRFDFDPDETVTGRTTYIIMACTGLGSMAIFGGLTAAVKAPIRRKLTAFALAIGVIWLLNLFRNVFIAIASPYGWFQFEPFIYIATSLMGAPESRTSFLVAHNFVAQTLSVVALVAITYMVIRILPEVLAILEDVLFVLTGNEYDLEDAVGHRPARADGGDEH